MTEAQHVRVVHVFTEKNPRHVASFHLGPRAGRAKVATRIRLADSQNVIAICELSAARSGPTAPASWSPSPRVWKTGI